MTITFYYMSFVTIFALTIDKRSFRYVFLKEDFMFDVDKYIGNDGHRLNGPEIMNKRGESPLHVYVISTLDS